MSLDLDELRLLRQARDQMDREYAEPLDVPALARTAAMSAIRHLLLLPLLRLVAYCSKAIDKGMVVEAIRLVEKTKE